MVSRRPHALVALSLLFIACGPNKVPVEFFVHGPADPMPRCAKGPAAMGQLHMRGKPIAKASLTLRSESGAVVHTSSDATGRTVLDLIPGRYTVTARARGHRIEPGKRVTIQPRTERVMEDLTLHPCISTGRHQYAVGFGKRVSIEAKNLCGRSWRGARYQWRQLRGPDVSSSLRGQTGLRISFTTHRVEQLRPLPDRPKVLAFSHPQAGEYLFELQATNERGERSRAEAFVSATTVVGGLTSVAPFARTVFCGEKQGPWDWRTTKIPKGFSVTLDDHTTRTPSLVARPQGALVAPRTVEIENRHNGLRFSVVVGGWSTVRRDCGRSECHRSLEHEWKKTLHAQSFKRLVDGTVKLNRGPASESCADCHAIGYDPGAKNGGYDDVAKALGYKIPLQRKKGNYAAAPQAIKDASGVYCLGCHGPGRLDPPIAAQPGLYGVGICARCHDRPPEQNLVAQWRRSRHAKSAPVAINGPARHRACARCHTAQGVHRASYTIARPHSDKTTFLNCCEGPEPVTCQACHNPMRATARKQVRRFGGATTPSGLKIESAGSGAQCLVCHHADADPASRKTLSERLAPHAPQADLLYGRAGYALPPPGKRPQVFMGKPTCAAKTKDSCVTCHMYKTPERGQPGHGLLGEHTFALRSDKKSGGHQLIAACTPCHANRKDFDAPAKGDHDGDGTVEGQQREIQGLLGRVETALRRVIATKRYRGCGTNGPGGLDPRGLFVAASPEGKIVVVDHEKRDLGDCDRNGVIERDERPFVFPERDLLLHQAAYNYLVIRRDGSLGLHNYPFALALLKATLEQLHTLAPPRRKQ